MKKNIHKQTQNDTRLIQCEKQNNQLIKKEKIK